MKRIITILLLIIATVATAQEAKKPEVKKETKDFIRNGNDF